MTLYFILKNYIRQRDGKSNVLLTIQSGTKKKRVATSVFIEPKYFSNKHNQWIKRSHPRHSELNTHLAEFYNKHRSEDVTTSIPSLSACIDQYLNSSFFLEYRPSHQERLQGVLNDWREFFHQSGILNRPYNQLNSKTVKSKLELMKKVGTSQSTVYKKLGVLKRCFTVLCDEIEYISTNPVQSITVPKGTTTKEKLPVEEVKSMLTVKPKSHAQQFALDMWRFSFFAQGIRISDIVDLRKEHIDWKNRRVGKNQVKTKNAISFAITDEIEQTLKKYDNPTQFAFDLSHDPNDSRSADRINSRIRKSLKGLCKREGIKRINKMHDARRAFTQIAVDAKLNIQDISASLGHSSTEVTHQYIGKKSNHINPELEHILKNQLGL